MTPDVVPTFADAVAFLRGACARSLHGGAPSLYEFRGGWAYASGASCVALAAHPCPDLEGESALDADLVDAALARLGADAGLGAGDGTLVLRAARGGRGRSVEIDVLGAPAPSGVSEPGAWDTVPEGLLAALLIAAKFCADGRDTRRWASGVLVRPGSLTAYNGRDAAVEVEVTGLDVGPLVIPAEAVGHLSSLGNPAEWSPGQASLGFRWPSGAWVLYRLVDSQWPEPTLSVVDRAVDAAPVAVDEDFRDAVADVAKLGDGVVRLVPGELRGRRSTSRVAVEVGCGVARETEWSAAGLSAVVAVADAWDPDAASGVARFRGPGIRGVIAGLRR